MPTIDPTSIENRNIIIYVHGTFSAAKTVTKGYLWNGTQVKTGLRDFTQENINEGDVGEVSVASKLKNNEHDSVADRIAQLMVLTQLDNPLVCVFGWSGSINTMEREEGGFYLAKILKALQGRGNTVHVITHSHGGNVLGHALTYFAPRPGGVIAQAYLFACPFFRGKRAGTFRVERDLDGFRFIKTAMVLRVSDENLWQLSPTSPGHPQGAQARVKDYVHNFYNPVDAVQVHGAGAAKGTVSNYTNFLLPEFSYNLNGTALVRNYCINPGGSRYDGKTAHTDMNHAFAYELAATEVRLRNLRGN